MDVFELRRDCRKPFDIFFFPSVHSRTCDVEVIEDLAYVHRRRPTRYEMQVCDSCTIIHLRLLSTRNHRRLRKFLFDLLEDFQELNQNSMIFIDRRFQRFDSSMLSKRKFSKRGWLT
jgi:hypothetical protein